MITNTQDGPLVQKAQALCQALVEEPRFQEVKSKLDAFLSDEMLKFQYQQVNDLGQILQMKQNDGLELKPEEIAQFETLREQLLGSEVARNFLEAQQEVQKVHQLVGQYLEQTFQLGRQPAYEDILSAYGCGDCGCHS